MDRNFDFPIVPAELTTLSLSARRAWIEMASLILPLSGVLSLSARRAWIEIRDCWLPDHSWWVALRKESVDRNRACTMTTTICIAVALRKESVDRNGIVNTVIFCITGSLSARRAWIEILARASSLAIRSWSLSARRAWIEIGHSEPGRELGSSRSPQGERG